MDEQKVLYQIKTLDKLIVRNLLIENPMGLKETLTPTQFQILEYILMHQKEEIYQKDLEGILNIRRATVSGVLQTMEKNHLISRVIDLGDQRVKKILLNDEAKQKFLKHKAKIHELNQVIIKGLNEEEIEVFLKVLKKMQQNVLDYTDINPR